jgi:hypothetical protein
MSEHPVLLLGREGGDHVRMELRGRLHPGATDFWDANWLDARVGVRAGAFSGTIRASLRTTDLAQWRDELRRLHESLSGQAALETMEGWISLRLTGDGRGHVAVDGVVEDEPGTGNRLSFALPALDQTDLPALLDALGAVERAFPTIGDPSG